MKDFLITENTIAIKRDGNKTIIYNVDNVIVINKKIRSIIEMNCYINGSSLEVRKKIAKKYLEKKYKIPIYVDNNVILLPIYSIRNKDSLFIVLDKFVNYRIVSTGLIIECIFNYSFSVRISSNSFEKLIINGVKLKNNLNWKKV